VVQECGVKTALSQKDFANLVEAALSEEPASAMDSAVFDIWPKAFLVDSHAYFFIYFMARIKSLLTG
jgi:negative regulator of sigma E activity